MVKVYGFMSWMSAGICFILWVFWAWVPDYLIDSVGITYYPLKWWAVALPTYLVVSLFSGAAMYAASFFIVAPALNSSMLIRDAHSEGIADESSKFDILNAHDLPLGLVNTLMFGD